MAIRNTVYDPFGTHDARHREVRSGRTQEVIHTNTSSPVTLKNALAPFHADASGNAQ